eukprot:1158547-Pelagomonas_calceolata.AAC.4
MPHSTFMMFMMAFGSSGTCGLPQGHGDDIEDISLPSEAKAKKDVENVSLKAKKDVENVVLKGQ